MSRLLLIVVAVLLVVAAVAVLWLALLPPEPAPQRIERPVPIDRAAPPLGSPLPAAPPPARTR